MSGGKGVGWLGSAHEQDSFLQYKVKVSTYGMYTMKIRYVSGEVRQANLRVHGIWKPEISFPSTGSWETCGLKEVQIQLNPGENTIRFFNRTAMAPDFDRIDFYEH